MKEKKSVLYSFSVPMPSKKEYIDKLISINKKVELSKITNLYFGLPLECDKASGFEHSKVATNIDIDFDVWKNSLCYAIENGFDITYLINSPKPFDTNELILNQKLEKLDILLNILSNLGVKKLRVANIPLIEYITKHYSNFDILLSTLFDYTNIGQYENLNYLYPQIKEIVPSYSINKNFKLLSNIHKKIPAMEIELMVNEHCTPSCALRTSHSLSMDNIQLLREIFKKDIFITNCFKTANQNKYLYACKTRCIYPWEINEYYKIGITHFKLVGRDTIEFKNGLFFNYCYDYLFAIDNYNKIKNYDFARIIFFPLNSTKYIKIEDVRKVLPNISYFKKHGHLCESICGCECIYCYKCAMKLEKLFENKGG